MTTQEKIEKAAQAPGEAAGSAEVILFGSHARGDANADSDVDFLVVEPEVKDRGKEVLRLRKTIRPFRIANDVLPYSQAEIDERKDVSANPVYIQ
ncbi:hypothetical protein MNBD_NITROSPINAE02-178 [hydrothermal vent metagenome]|uniref:Polymerase nucleotidyl transferase domain-containing protein n=1 Tax=hydrothermal vent metagenome TaxID=652676 RepID=A0A3B1C733_9ZZZZ